MSLAASPVATALKQARPETFTCQSVGSGTICHYSSPDSYGPVDTGIVCGSGASAFNIFDQGIANDFGTFWFDRNDDLTKFTHDVIYSFGEWSNPLSGATVSYTQHNTETFVLAVPGDFTSATVTSTGETVIRAPTGQRVLLAVGRQVYNFDMSELLSSHGPNAFVAAFYEGDPQAFEQVCTALSG